VTWRRNALTYYQHFTVDNATNDRPKTSRSLSWKQRFEGQQPTVGR